MLPAICQKRCDPMTTKNRADKATRIQKIAGSGCWCLRTRKHRTNTTSKSNIALPM